MRLLVMLSVCSLSFASVVLPSPGVCTTDEDCRLGNLDPKSTCEDGTCVCHTQGYAHPPGVPLCLPADDVTVPMAFAVGYGEIFRSLWNDSITVQFEQMVQNELGRVTDVRTVDWGTGILVLGMVDVNTTMLADVLSGNLNLTAVLYAEYASVSHGVTCASADASYTVQYQGWCFAVQCESTATLALKDGVFICKPGATAQPEVNTATPHTDLPAGASFAPPPPPGRCTTDEDCRLGNLDPKSTCEDGMCVCHTQGYAHPPGVPLCLLADDVTVPMAFAVGYRELFRSLWNDSVTVQFEQMVQNELGRVTDVRTVDWGTGILVLGMVDVNTTMLADVLSGNLNLTAVLYAEDTSVSHGVTCASADASYTVQYQGVCFAVQCESIATLALKDGVFICKPGATAQPEVNTATPHTDLPAGASFAPPPPPGRCTTDEDCRLGNLDPKSTCEDGTCVCHTQGYAHPPGVPLCLPADDVTVPMAFAVGYGEIFRSLWNDSITVQFEQMVQNELGRVTDVRTIDWGTGILVLGMVDVNTTMLADVLSGNLNLTAVLYAEDTSVSHGVTCASADASYTVQYQGVCFAVQCENIATLALKDGVFTCEGVPSTTAPTDLPATQLPPTDLPASSSFAPPTSAPPTALPTATPTDLPATLLPASSTFAPPTSAPPTALPTATPTNLPATQLPAGSSFAPPTSAPPTALPTATPTDLPATLLPASSTFAPPTSAPPTALPTATPTNLPATLLPAGSSFAPPTSAPPTALPTATPTDLPAGATFAPPPPPSVNALCTTDEDCRSGRLDPKSTCQNGTCVCHTQGYAHPPGVPLCLLADDVTVPMAFAVEYYGVEAQSLWTTATTRESFEDTMGEALGTVTDLRVVVSDGGVLVVGMVRASTAKLADALSGKEDLAAALSSEGVSVSHGVTCARTDASYTVQHNGVCNAVECEGSTTLTLTDGTYRCEREAAPQPEESGSGSGSESGVSSKMFLYVGIGVGVLGVAVGVVVAFCCLQKKQPAKELESPLNKVPLGEEAELYDVGETLN